MLCIHRDFCVTSTIGDIQILCDTPWVGHVMTFFILCYSGTQSGVASEGFYKKNVYAGAKILDISVSQELTYEITRPGLCPSGERSRSSMQRYMRTYRTFPAVFKWLGSLKSYTMMTSWSITSLCLTLKLMQDMEPIHKNPPEYVLPHLHIYELEVKENEPKSFQSVQFNLQTLPETVILTLWCPCPPSTVNWYQLASGLGVRWCVQ